jgi:cell division protein FtsL
MSKGSRVGRWALLLALLLGSLTLVVWRQSRALVVLGDLDTVRRERVLEEARRGSLLRRIESLESRSRVTAEAGTKFGMRLPNGNEIVILPLRPSGADLALSTADAGGGG